MIRDHTMIRIIYMLWDHIYVMMIRHHDDIYVMKNHIYVMRHHICDMQNQIRYHVMRNRIRDRKIQTYELRIHVYVMRNHIYEWEVMNVLRETIYDVRSYVWYERLWYAIRNHIYDMIFEIIYMIW